MTNIIKVDFKTKQKMEEHHEYDWLDVLTGKVHHYDSRRKDNVEHFSMPCYLFDQKRNSVNLDLFFSLESFKSICKDLEI